MELYNIDNDLPSYFYIFLSFGNDIYNQINENNYNLNKTLTSSGMMNIYGKLDEFMSGEINYLPFKRTEVTTNSPSSFVMSIINNYNTEHNLEQYRKNIYRKYPSRLSSLYAFGDYESCIKVAQKYNWDLNTVKKFELTTALKIGKFNMEIVSLIRGIGIPRFSIEDQNRLYDQYWQCSPNANVEIQNIRTGQFEKYNSGCIHEYLIEGSLKLVE